MIFYASGNREKDLSPHLFTLLRNKGMHLSKEVGKVPPFDHQGTLVAELIANQRAPTPFPPIVRITKPRSVPKHLPPGRQASKGTLV